MKDAQKKKNKKKSKIQWLMVLLLSMIIVTGLLLDIELARGTLRNSGAFLKTMLFMFPGAFILIGLFETWINRELVERHLGETSGLKAQLWAILLASTIMAPLVVALPLAKSLKDKGASQAVVLSFLSASTICRIPMTVFEASYLGLPYSLIRLLTALPLVVLSSLILGRRQK